tara:strand:+ start:4230 stop:5372 length:1143 start_codon:yes stop_codon:yes gene_type:complete
MKLLFFTGSRSEWGYLRPILEYCKQKKVNFKLCATNMLLLDSFGYPVKEIEKDGFKVDEKIYMALDGYNTFTTSKSMGILMSSLTDTVQRINPDWIVLAGDRGETLIASLVGAYTNTPIAHIQAGELSGNIDGSARHAIGKFAHLHFASNLDAFNRLLKLGEEKHRVKLVGAPQLDDLYSKKFNYENKKKFLKKYGINIRNNFILVVYHPVTEELKNIKRDFKKFYSFLEKKNLQKVWISPNNDAGSSIIKSEFLKLRDTNDVVFDNLPREDYLTLLKNCKLIIGNSSSGIIESSTFKTPCINIGRRQNNRFRAANVIDVLKIESNQLEKAYKKALSSSFKNKIIKIKNPYGDGKSSKLIVDIILNTKIDENLIKKELTF